MGHTQKAETPLRIAPSTQFSEETSEPKGTATIENIEDVHDKPEQNVYGRIIDIIRRNDTGTGVDTSTIIAESGISHCEQILTTLLKEGEIFEVRPGRIKILE